MSDIFCFSSRDARLNACKAIMSAPDGYYCIIKGSTRTLEQNDKLWPMLQDVSRQVEWHGHKLSNEEWKDFFTASLKQQKVVPNMDGTGFVVIGMSTSVMSKRMFIDLIDLIYAFGSDHGVVWS